MPTTERQIRPDSSPPGAGAADPLVSVIIPCLNEAAHIERCVELAHEALEEGALSGEVVVVDNGSEDGSGALAESAGARVVDEPRRGYGSAYLAGLAAARGTYVVMLDADLTYDFKEIPRFVEELESGAELVIGDRMGNIEPGAMHWLHRYVGNPLLTRALNLFFKTGVKDAHCGLRAVRRDVLPRLDLRTTGMEFASEMVVRAAKEELEIHEVPIRYHPRSGESKLSRFRDGWRHLRFLLVHSPTYLFVAPGALMVLLGALVMLTVIANINVLGRQWDVHTMIAGALLTIVGTQVVALGLAAHAYASYYMQQRDPWFHWARDRFRLEHGLAAGLAVVLAGFAVGAVIVVRWIDRGFGELAEAQLAILAATLVVIGTQVIFSSFLLSIIGLRRVPPDEDARR
jgi:glycosyltransferase involved in cell wall biosynthesis